MRSKTPQWLGAWLALALITSSGPARGQVSSTPGNALERAASLVRARDFDRAAATLRGYLAVDPSNRAAREMLAFTLESTGDLEGERQVRSALASDFPNDPRIQADLGRVLERSGAEDDALRAYRRARELHANRPSPELDAAIERMKGRTALELGAPLSYLSDPDATATSLRMGAAVPFGSQHHWTLMGTHHVAEGKPAPGSRTLSDALAISLVLEHASGDSCAMGPHVHVVSRPGDARPEVGWGGAVAGRAPLGSSLEVHGRAELDSPWDEAAVTVLRGGRTTSAEAQLYAHGFSRRLLLQAGARRRQLSILGVEPSSTQRASAWQSLGVAGADVVVWRKPGVSVPGEMLDESLIAPSTLSPAITLAYRHYEVSTRTTPEFASLLGLAPLASVNEVSAATTLTSPRGRVALQLGGGFAHDNARDARLWRAGGSLTWAPRAATRFALGYDGSSEFASGLVGQRRAGWVSIHADF